MGDVLQVLTTGTFDQVIDSGTPVLVDFWLEGCAPCKSMEPVLEEVASEQAGKLVVGKVDILAEPDLALRYEVSAVPLLVLFRRGEVLAKLTGARGKHDLMSTLRPLL